MTRWTLDHGQLTLNGTPVLTMIRAVWGDGYAPAADIDALERRIAALLNADEPPAIHPYRPSAIRNDRCLDCGEYEEDGPHAAIG